MTDNERKINEKGADKMTKKEEIISNIMNGYRAYVTHNGGIFKADRIEDVLNRIIEFKGCNGYQLRVNDRYSVDMSAKLYEYKRGHYEWYNIGSFLDIGAWHIGGKLVCIDTDYKKEEERI